VGGVGVSGDTSCADHNIAWRVRHNLVLDHLASVPGPASLFAGDAGRPDNIIFDIAPNPNGGTGVSASGFGHPTCLNTHGSATPCSALKRAGPDVGHSGPIFASPGPRRRYLTSTSARDVMFEGDAQSRVFACVSLQ
jgi:hypothetical protein